MENLRIFCAPATPCSPLEWRLFIFPSLIFNGPKGCTGILLIFLKYLLITKIERTEKVWGSKREYLELCLDMLSLRCSFDIRWEIISWHSWDSGERVRELVLYQPVNGIWSHEVGWDHVGNMCRQKRGEVQELGTPTFPGQRATRGKPRKKSEEKQTRMVPWKTEESVSRNRIISCQILPMGQGR